MQQSGVCNTRCQLFFNEVTKRECRLRTKWFLTNKKRLLDNLERSHVRKAKMIIQDNTMINNKPIKKVEISFRRRKINDDLFSFKQPQFNEIPINYMKPVDPQIKAILYEQNNRSFDAKQKYLIQRYKELPEDRYYYPDCHSWLYGWRLKNFEN